MKRLIGIGFLVALVALLALLVPKKNRNNIKQIQTAVAVRTNSTLTVNNVNPGFPTDEK